MDTPKVSIIVPCYGVEKYLDRCMDSIVNQTLKDIEIIMVDDGSPDRVPDMCDEWAMKDSRIKVIHKQNGGLGYARNSGLDKATGDYIAFVDSDDFIDTRMFEKLYSEAHITSADLVFCGINNESPHNIWIAKPEVNSKAIVEGRDNIKALMLDFIATKPHYPIERPYRMSVWHGLYKHSIIKEKNIRFFSERVVVSEDLPFQCQYISASHKIVFLPECYYYYCLNFNSLTATFKKEKFEGFLNLRRTIIDIFPGDNEVLLRIDRHIIGLFRNFFRQLIFCSYSDKLLLTKEILSNSFWHEVRYEYSPTYLPLYPSVTYWLQINQYPILLLLWLKISFIFKRKVK